MIPPLDFSDAKAIVALIVFPAARLRLREHQSLGFSFLGIDDPLVAALIESAERWDLDADDRRELEQSTPTTLSVSETLGWALNSMTGGSPATPTPEQRIEWSRRAVVAVDRFVQRHAWASARKLYTEIDPDDHSELILLHDAVGLAVKLERSEGASWAA